MREGADDGHRHRERGDRGRGEVAEEEEDHQHDEGQRDEQRDLDVVDRVADRLRAVEHDVHRDARGQLLLERWQQLAHRLVPPHGVGSRLLLNRQHDRALVDEPGRGLVVLHAVEDACRAPPGAQAFRCGRRRRWGDSAPALVSWPAVWMVYDFSGPQRMPVGRLTLLFLTACMTSSKPMSAGRELPGVHLDAHRVLLAAVDVHLGHAGNHGDALRDHGLAVLVELVQGQARARSGR